MVRTAGFKYCVYEHGERREMLIDLNRDPGEMNNLAGSPEHMDELNHHRRLLVNWVERNGDTLARSYMVPPGEIPHGRRATAESSGSLP
jgi:hypothetical protein